jgi:hypothetical protein
MPRLPSAFIRLPLHFDAAALAAELAALPDSYWQPHPQGFSGNDAIALISPRGRPEDDGLNPPMQPTPTLARLPAFQQALSKLASTLGRTRLMRLAPGAEASEHVDSHPYWFDHLRVHIPIVTQPSVMFYCGYQAVHMQAGEAWVFDSWRPHRICNASDTPRIHLVVDTVGSRRLWDAIRQNRPLEAGALRFEQAELPLVMPPLELAARLRFIAGGSVSFAPLEQLIGRLVEDWTDCWQAEAAAEAYRALWEQFSARLQEYSGKVRLKNGLDLAATLSAGLAPRMELLPKTCPIPAFGRPIFIISPPRSGSSLLFELLARSPGVWSIGGESHAVIEAFSSLTVQENGWSNRLTQKQATPEVAAALKRAFYLQLRDSVGGSPGVGLESLRFLEKTPKNSLRLPFLHAIFPDARFVVLCRTPEATISSMLEGWQSNAFLSYPNLPGLKGWNFLLPAGWQTLVGRPLVEVVASQWASTIRILLEDLKAVPEQQCYRVDYETLLSTPEATMQALFNWLELPVAEIPLPLPVAAHTLSAPAPDKWRKNEAALKMIAHLYQDQAARLAGWKP